MSAGEIQIISLFLPLLQIQIRRKLSALSDTDQKSYCCDVVVLMEMPNIFLPEQQLRLLEYLRAIVKEEDGNTQFIIVSSSSALIDKAVTEESYMLIPPWQLVGGSNQLVKVSDTNMCLMPL